MNSPFVLRKSALRLASTVNNALAKGHTTSVNMRFHHHRHVHHRPGHRLHPESAKYDLLTKISISEDKTSASAVLPINKIKLQLDGHFPAQPVLPAVFTLHAMFHLSAFLVHPSVLSDASVSHLSHASFRRAVTPNDGKVYLSVRRLENHSFHALATLPAIPTSSSPVLAAEAKFCYEEVTSE